MVLKFPYYTHTQVNPKMTFEVFIHKVDGLADENKLERSQNIQQRYVPVVVRIGTCVQRQYVLIVIYTRPIA